MAKIIDLSAICPEPIVVKLPNDIYTIPATISVAYMTKIMKLQEQISNVTDKSEYFSILKELAVAILSLDKSKTVTMETVETELDDTTLLIALPKLFNEKMTEAISESVPVNPNATTPAEK